MLMIIFLGNDSYSDFNNTFFSLDWSAIILEVVSSSFFSELCKELWQ